MWHVWRRRYKVGVLQLFSAQSITSRETRQGSWNDICLCNPVHWINQAVNPTKNKPLAIMRSYFNQTICSRESYARSPFSRHISTKSIFILVFFRFFSWITQFASLLISARNVERFQCMFLSHLSGRKGQREKLRVYSTEHFAFWVVVCRLANAFDDSTLKPADWWINTSTVSQMQVNDVFRECELAEGECKISPQLANEQSCRVEAEQ